MFDLAEVSSQGKGAEAEAPSSRDVLCEPEPPTRANRRLHLKQSLRPQPGQRGKYTLKGNGLKRSARSRSRQGRGGLELDRRGRAVLKEFVAIKNVGRFGNSACTPNPQLKRQTFVAGANGFGRTTICAILRLTGEPSVELLLDSGWAMVRDATKGRTATDTDDCKPSFRLEPVGYSISSARCASYWRPTAARCILLTSRHRIGWATSCRIAIPGTVTDVVKALRELVALLREIGGLVRDGSKLANAIYEHHQSRRAAGNLDGLSFAPRGSRRYLEAIASGTGTLEDVAAIAASQDATAFDVEMSMQELSGYRDALRQARGKPAADRLAEITYGEFGKDRLRRLLGQLVQSCNGLDQLPESAPGEAAAILKAIEALNVQIVGLHDEILGLTK